MTADYAKTHAPSPRCACAGCRIARLPRTQQERILGRLPAHVRRQAGLK